LAARLRVTVTLVAEAAKGPCRARHAGRYFVQRRHAPGWDLATGSSRRRAVVI